MSWLARLFGWGKKEEAVEPVVPAPVVVDKGYKFSKRSIANLKTCHPLLYVLALEAIKEFDFVVICGHRSVTEQQALYAQGRTRAGKIVTNIDGIKKKSKHNQTPSLAMDLVPHPIDWNDIERFKELGKIIKRLAKEANTPLSWGGDWRSFKDYPHFELKK